jgi:hypothetical protein
MHSAHESHVLSAAARNTRTTKRSHEIEEDAFVVRAQERKSSGRRVANGDVRRKNAIDGHDIESVRKGDSSSHERHDRSGGGREGRERGGKRRRRRRKI